MGTDKLNVTARAAGFAMACDEIAAVPQAGAAMLATASIWAARPPTASVNSTALVPVRQPKVSLGWNMIGWSFWKTA